MALACTGSECDRRSDRSGDCITDPLYVGGCGGRDSGCGRRGDASVPQKENGILSHLWRQRSQPDRECDSGPEHRVFRSICSAYAADYLAADQKHLV